MRVWTGLIFLIAAVCGGARAEADDPGLVSHFPPAKNDLAAPGAETFLVCARDDAPGRSKTVFRTMASLYEYTPGQAQLTKRAELVPADTAPRPELLPEFLLQTVPKTNGLHESWLYHVDYRTWEIRRLPLLNARGVGANAQRAYFRTDKEIRVVDRRTLEVSPLARPAEALGPVDGGAWLIHYHGDPEKETRVYDFKLETGLGRLELPGGYETYGEPHARLSPQRDCVAFFHALGRQVMAKSVRKTVKTEFTLCALPAGTRRTLPVVVYMAYRNTFGVSPFYVDFDWGFSADGAAFHYVTALKADEAADDMQSVPSGFEEVVVDLKQGTQTRRPWSRPAERAPAPRAGFYVPPYLADRPMERPRDVITGLLDAAGIDLAGRRGTREDYRYTSAFTHDTKRFLALVQTLNGRRQWIYGNLETKQVERFDAPLSLSSGDFHILAVRVPGEGVPVSEELAQ